MKKKSNSPKGYRKKIPVVVELPTNSVDMENFVRKNRILINETIVDSLDYAIRKNFGGIEVFAFKDSSYVVVINRNDFKDNLQNIFDYSLKMNFSKLVPKLKRLWNSSTSFHLS